MMEKEIKYCPGCANRGLEPWRSLSEFGLRSDRPSGLKSRCKECINSARREKYHNDPEFAAKDIAKAKKWAKDNPEKHNESTKEWARKNPDKVAANGKNWYGNNKERVRENQRIYECIRYNTDLQYKLRKLLRTRVAEVIRELKIGKKAGSAVKDLGCSVNHLISFLGQKFAPEMTWENHGKLWEVDHIRPLVDFDLTDREQFLVACNYTNLQPLWIDEHLEKTKREATDRCKSSIGQ